MEELTIKVRVNRITIDNREKGVRLVPKSNQENVIEFDALIDKDTIIDLIEGGDE